MDNKNTDKKQIRNSTVDFLVFTKKERLQMMCGGSLSIAARESGDTVLTVFVSRPT